jgi:hypothetical protein
MLMAFIQTIKVMLTTGEARKQHLPQMAEQPVGSVTRTSRKYRKRHTKIAVNPANVVKDS